MKIIHTSDWHIGRTLYGRKRYDEFEAFLNWLADYIKNEEIEALLVSGDIFDNIAPSNRAQELYYRFLCSVVDSRCRHVVITAGNHDSPSFLNAPREVLRYLNVHIIGCISDSISDEVITLSDEKGVPELIVCAVPYLRDRDVRKAEAGESYEDKGRKLIDGIRSHYAGVCAEAERIRQHLDRQIPIIAMGHLFTAGGQTIDSDGVRDLYVGSLAHVEKDIFPSCIDYLALGHLHIPQRVGDSDFMRYSGSPIPMGFGEAKHQKVLCQVEFEGGCTNVADISIPGFQNLECIKGDWEHITSRLEEIKALERTFLLDIIYNGEQIIGDLQDRLDELTAGTSLEVLRIKNNRVIDRSMTGSSHESLADLSIDEVFKRCLDANEVPPEQQDDLIQTYREAAAMVQEEDAGMETGA
ncbi:MAG: exonuclease SbcCD subunit D C-terminal domain-containing protein [Syntrophomonas sp.]